MTAIYVWLAILTALQIVNMLADMGNSMKIKELEKVFDKMNDLSERQSQGFIDSYKQLQQLSDKVASLIKSLDIERKLNKP